MPNTDIRENKPFKTNQISSTKPNVPNSMNMLSGYIANSMNGGHNKVISWKQVMAGEKHSAYRVKMCIQMLTPKTPTYQNLTCTLRTYFVPNSRVWKNAEKYTAQKGGISEAKIAEIPNYGGKLIPFIEDGNGDGEQTLLCNSTYWRDSFISSYIPRIGQPGTSQNTSNFKWTKYLPKGSILPLRGYIAIHNDMLRNKEYDTPYTEYNEDTVSENEWKSYLPVFNKDIIETEKYNVLTGRAKRNNSYYSDYRTEYQGFEEAAPALNEDSGLLSWASYESLIAEARSEAENAQMNDWEIISKIRGSKLLTEGKVQLIGKKSFNLNYAAITQNAYNNNTNIAEEFRVLGKQGAYSYTEIDLPAYEGVEFVEEGYIHVIATVTADNVYESGFDRLELNVTPLSQYRPDLITQKDDVLYNIEVNSYYGQNPAQEALTTDNVIGFKRKFSEYFKLPNIISGDMCNKNWYDDNESGQLSNIYYITEMIGNSTFQFFEISDQFYLDNMTGEMHGKNRWMDYTDILINKNQAIKNIVKSIQPTYADSPEATRVTGQNQIFFVGKAYCYADLPIDEAIKNNYTKWGEH